MNYDTTRFALGKKKSRLSLRLKKGEVTYYTPGAVVKFIFWLSLIYLTPSLGKRGEKQAACNMYYLFSATIEVDS